jgi:hypothetical protein
MPSRPPDEHYYIDSRTQHVAQGDIFRDIEFRSPEDANLSHTGPGMLLNYTSGMLVGAEGTNRDYLHRFRVVAPIFALAHIPQLDGRWTHEKVTQLRRDDNFGGWMYLPPLPPHFEESAVALFRPVLIAQSQLENERIAQTTEEATRWLERKLGRVFLGVDVDLEELNPNMSDHWEGA